MLPGLLASALSLPPLTPARWLSSWSLDLPVLVLVLALAGPYLVGVASARRSGACWPVSRLLWFLVAGLGSVVVVTMSFLGSYNRVLFWPLAVQDVLLLTVPPLGLTLGRPVALMMAARRPAASRRVRPSRALARVLSFPLTGSLLATWLLLAIYTTSWQQVRLEHAGQLELSHLLLVAAGCLFLWPLLGVDHSSGNTSYGVRTVIALLDGLLDALPGIAVLATGHVIAGAYYRGVNRQWGPSLLQDQRIGGTAMVALSELVGLPTLLIVLVQWVRSDGLEALVVDAELDVVYAAEAAAAGHDSTGQGLQRPWWELDPSRLSYRAQQRQRNRQP